MGVVKTEAELEAAAQVIRDEVAQEGNTRQRVYDWLSNINTTMWSKLGLKLEQSSIDAIKDNVPIAGDTMNKLYALITDIQALLASNDINYDTFQEIVDFIKTIDTSGELVAAIDAAVGNADWRKLPTAVLNYTDSEYPTSKAVIDGTPNVAQAEKDAMNVGQKYLFTAEKLADNSLTYGAGVDQIDKIVSTTFSVLLADTADWGNVAGKSIDHLELTGDNRNGELGENSQEFVDDNGQYFLCISHNNGTTALDGSAIWVRNRNRDALNPGLAQDANIITELTTEAGWDAVNNVKVINVRSKVGSWYTGASGYTYFCFDDSGASWSWRRVGQPSAEFIQITDAALKAEIEAHDFATTPILLPVSAEIGKDRQEHFWTTGGGATPNLAECIDDAGTIKWIKVK